jgi:transposase
MRKGFEGLYGLVRDRLSCEPLSGHLFLFCNGQRNRLKVLVWDGSGLWVCAKRLEKGRFTWPQSGDAQGKVILSHEELSLLLGGIDVAVPSFRVRIWNGKGHYQSDPMKKALRRRNILIIVCKLWRF